MVCILASQKQLYKYVNNFVQYLAFDRDFKITLVMVCIVMFIRTTSLFPSSTNAKANDVFGQVSNSSVIVENRAIST